jgi:hypothetical protein
MQWCNNDHITWPPVRLTPYLVVWRPASGRHLPTPYVIPPAQRHGEPARPSLQVPLLGMKIVVTIWERHLEWHSWMQAGQRRQRTGLSRVHWHRFGKGTIINDTKMTLSICWYVVQASDIIAGGTTIYPGSLTMTLSSWKVHSTMQSETELHHRAILGIYICAMAK